MRIRFGEIWDRLNTGYWFVPSGMAAGGILVAIATVSLDEALSENRLRQLNWAYRGGPEGAAGVLSAIAGSMITIAGLVFSLTLVSLTLASSQFGPRLLRNFIRDRITQFVMGTFLAAFLYSLFVLRTIRRGDHDEFVPHISVTISVVFAVAGMVMLVYFIHHLATSIQADTLIARVSADLVAVIDRLYPEEIGGESKSRPSPTTMQGDSVTVTGVQDGYIQIIDGDAIVHVARENNLLIELLHRPGHYVFHGLALARIWPTDRVTDEIKSAVDQSFVRGPMRTPAQDAEFVINQLVEIALRALSPGINDPFTAVTCIDRLASGMARLARREAPSEFRVDADGVVRVIAHSAQFPDILDAAFNQIRQAGQNNAAIIIRLLDVIADLATVVTQRDARDGLVRHAEMLERAARVGLTEENDLRDVEERVRSIARALSDKSEEP